MAARVFPRGAVASPHALASQAGHAVLAGGGNALDAAIATHLVLGVVAPYFCGLGGDLFAVVWDGRLRGYLGSGRSPATASAGRLRAETGVDRVPTFGPHSVTVPGAVAGVFDLLARWGTRSFGDLAAAAHRYARDGFAVTEVGAGPFAAYRPAYEGSAAWLAAYGDVRAGSWLVQPGAARLLETLAADGPGACYGGPIGAAIADTVARAGGDLCAADVAAHVGEWTAPLVARFRDVEVAELPPPTQGVTALEALRVIDGLSLDGPPDDREHQMIEAVKLALSDRDAHVSDPVAMRVPPSALLDEEFVSARRALVDRDRAGHPRPGRPQTGGTAYLCAADAGGLLVSLIQSNFTGFGSGVHVAEWGLNLNNRGSSFSLDPDSVNVLAPAKRPMHTLVPAMTLREGRPVLVFGTMGADAQTQVHVQLLRALLDDHADLQDAIDAPRWRVEPGSWRLRVESRMPADVVDGLGRRGHDVRVGAALDSRLGHAHAIAVGPRGYEVASDPRAEGAALGF